MSRGQSTSPNISSIDKSGNTMALPKLKARHGIVRKPVIASLAGTTKAVSLSQRPQPPSKPRSERPLSAGGSYKPCTLAQQVSGEEMKNLSNQQSTFFGGQNLAWIRAAVMTMRCQALGIQHRVGIKEHREERVKNSRSLINIKLSPNTAAPRVTPAELAQAPCKASNPPLSC